MKWFFVKTVILIAGISVGVFASSKLDFLGDITGSYASKDIDISYVKSENEDNIYRNNLVLVNSYYDDFIIDLKYASKDNVSKSVLYGNDLLYMQKNTLDKLIKVNEELMAKGYKIKIWDGYRPLSVQKKLWAIVPNSNYIANPFTTGSNHNRGTAVDITLVDLEGKEVKMPTGFDNFTGKSDRGYKWSKDESKNVERLTDVMSKNGFNFIDTEWWHYDDVDAKRYPIMNYDSVDLLKK